MNIIEKAYCRTYQAAFKAAIPLMPYREPKILTNVSKIGPLLEAKKIKSVLLVTDKGIRNAGLTAKLEEKLVYTTEPFPTRQSTMSKRQESFTKAKNAKR